MTTRHRLPQARPARRVPPVSARSRQQLLDYLPVRERRLRLNGVETAVLEGGAGLPLVLLHGPGEHAPKWLRILPELVTTFRVIAPDLPGHGESEPMPQVTVDAVMGWLDDLIECTCEAPPVLIGQILGGAIAARFASTRGDRIRQLVLSDMLGLAPFQPAPQFGQALTEFLAEPNGATHDRLWTYCTHDLDALRTGMGEQWTRIRAYNLDRARAPDLRLTQQALFEQFGLPAVPADELARIPVPTALVWGRHDLATPLSVAEAASARFGWPLYVIEGAADDPPIEQPEAFLEVLRTVLEASGASSRDGNGTAERWDRIAPGYDEFVTPSHMWLAHEGLRRAGLRAGERFLDVAAGSGALSIPAARLGARVTSVDQSPVMLDLLSRRALREGLEIQTRVMDGHFLEFEAGSFDVAGSQFGVMLFPDMPRGIREMARVVKPGGRVLIHAYGDPSGIEFLGFLVGAIQTVRPAFAGLPNDPPPLPLQLQDPERLRHELASAGLPEVRIETITETLTVPAGSGLWNWLTSSNPIVETVLGGMLQLGPEERDAVRRALEDLVRERAGGATSARLTNPVHIGIGNKR